LLAFIEWNYYVRPEAKLVQRLDGIWFNTGMNWKRANETISETYKKSDGVIFQSEFNKKLTEKYFGKCESDNIVIHNGCSKLDEKAGSLQNARSLRMMIDSIGGKMFVCASNWRPHKRLKEILKFFQKVAGKCDRLVVVGRPNNVDDVVADERIIWLGDSEQDMYLSICSVADYMVHLAWLDHCPNVVVEALSVGCPVICTDSGGTSELVEGRGIVFPDKEWDFEPHDLYDPPELNLDECARMFEEKSVELPIDNNDLDIEFVAKKYVDFFKTVLEA